ncbi:MAG: hypothetical protein HT579_06800 [Candidatus Accumulibacter similis]|nr:MAG: hypothetical protein HT579_06800 [Candidatus Accumulibacter similis]
MTTSVLPWLRRLRHFRKHIPFEKTSSMMKNGGTSSPFGGHHGSRLRAAEQQRLPNIEATRELSQTAAKTSVWSLEMDFVSSQRR